MEEAPEHGKELTHSAHGNGMNELSIDIKYRKKYKGEQGHFREIQNGCLWEHKEPTVKGGLHQMVNVSELN